MEEWELLVQSEAVVHQVLRPDQLMTNVAIALVHDDQLDVLILDDITDGVRGQACTESESA